MSIYDNGVHTNIPECTSWVGGIRETQAVVQEYKQANKQNCADGTNLFYHLAAEWASSHKQLFFRTPFHHDVFWLPWVVTVMGCRKRIRQNGHTHSIIWINAIVKNGQARTPK